METHRFRAGQTFDVVGLPGQAGARAGRWVTVTGVSLDGTLALLVTDPGAVTPETGAGVRLADAVALVGCGAWVARAAADVPAG